MGVIRHLCQFRKRMLHFHHIQNADLAVMLRQKRHHTIRIGIFQQQEFFLIVQVRLDHDFFTGVSQIKSIRICRRIICRIAELPFLGLSVCRICSHFGDLAAVLVLVHV